MRLLQEKGLKSKVIKHHKELSATLQNSPPRILVVDLLFPRLNALDCLSLIRENNLDTKVIIISGHSNPKNVKRSIAAGAVDYLVKPFDPVDILSRIVFHLQTHKTLDQNRDNLSQDSAHIYQKALKKMTEDIPLPQLLWHLTKLIARPTQAIRCSVVSSTDKKEGLVLASSDHKELDSLTLQLSKYPEITHVLHSQKMVAIDNLKKNVTMSKILKELKEIQFSSLIVAPLIFQGNSIGVISIRMKDRNSISQNELQFVHSMADITALTLAAHRAIAPK